MGDPEQQQQRQGLHPAVIILIVVVIALPLLCVGVSIVSVMLIGTQAETMFEEIEGDLTAPNEPMRVEPVPAEAPVEPPGQ